MNEFEIFQNAKRYINLNEFNHALTELLKIPKESETMTIIHMKILCWFMLDLFENVIEIFYSKKKIIMNFIEDDNNIELRKILACCFWEIGFKKKAKFLFNEISDNYEISTFQNEFLSENNNKNYNKNYNKNDNKNYDKNYDKNYFYFDENKLKITNVFFDVVDNLIQNDLNSVNNNNKNEIINKSNNEKIEDDVTLILCEDLLNNKENYDNEEIEMYCKEIFELEDKYLLFIDKYLEKQSEEENSKIENEIKKTKKKMKKI